MNDAGSLINLGELSKPATVLIEKISDAVGGYFRPYQVRRMARAEADAEEIHALAELEIGDLQRRALQRFVAEEARKQDNIEAIASQALPGVEEDARPDDVDDDWITNFFEKARLISDEEMQQLWAKILAGEANSPSRFSKRTVNYMASLDKDDAELFQKLLGFGWAIGEVSLLVYDVHHEIYTAQGINFTTLTHLDEIGLVSFDNLAGFTRIDLPDKVRAYYYGHPIDLEIKKDQNRLVVGKVRLSRVGQDLAPVVDAHPVDGFIDYVLEIWREAGGVVSSPLEASGRSSS